MKRTTEEILKQIQMSPKDELGVTSTETFSQYERKKTAVMLRSLRKY